MFYWPGLRTDIIQFVKECIVCQRNKVEHIHPPSLLQLIPLPDSAWVVISLDFVEGLPKSKGKDTILVVVDRFTKYCHLIPLTHPYTADKITQEFLDNMVKLHGMPEAIISDRDPIFINTFWKELFTSLGTKIKLSTAYHPQTNGQTECVNQCIEMFLRCVAGHKPDTWVTWLSLAKWWYNTSHHSALNMSPFQALYSTPPTSLNFSYNRTNDAEVNEYLRDMKATQQLIKAQECMKWYSDKKITDMSFMVNDEVFLKLQPYRQQSVNERRNHKLSAHINFWKKSGKWLTNWISLLEPRYTTSFMSLN